MPEGRGGVGAAIGTPIEQVAIDGVFHEVEVPVDNDVVAMSLCAFARVHEFVDDTALGDRGGIVGEVDVEDGQGEGVRDQVDLIGTGRRGCARWWGIWPGDGC